MFGGNRGYIAAAIFGLAACCFGLGALSSSQGTDEPHRYPRYSESASEPPSATGTPASKSVQRTEEKEPCVKPRNREESDLCAQWSAADASRDAADWGWWQLIFSAFGVIGLGLTLWFNLQAWRQARDGEEGTRRALLAAEKQSRAAERAADLSERNSLLLFRAYVAVDRVIFIDRMGVDGRLKIGVVFRNGGQTPAFSVKTHVNVSAVLGSPPDNLELPPFEGAPEDYSTTSILPAKEIPNNCDIAVPANLEQELFSGNAKIWVRGWCEYVDVFREPHRTAFKVRCDKDTMKSGILFAITPDGNEAT